MIRYPAFLVEGHPFALLTGSRVVNIISKHIPDAAGELWYIVRSPAGVEGFARVTEVSSNL